LSLASESEKNQNCGLDWAEPIDSAFVFIPIDRQVYY